MEDQQEDVDAFLAYMAEHFGLEDVPPYATALYIAKIGYQNFLQNGAKDQIDAAIKFARISLRYDHRTSASTGSLQNNLGVFLEARFERTGDMADLEEAIQINRRAVASAPENDPNFAAYHNNLGNKLERRYDRTGDINDLDEAVQISERAVALTSEDQSNLAIRLSNLSQIFAKLYKRRQDMSDLEKAIQALRRAATSVSDGHSNLATYLGNLSNQLDSRYQRTGDTKDLEESLQIARRAVSLGSTSEDYSKRADQFHGLGNTLELRYMQTGDMNDLKEAIEMVTQAIVLMPENHPDSANYLNDLGNKLMLQYMQTGDAAYLGGAGRVFGRSWGSYGSAPFTRIYGASWYLKVLIFSEMYNEAAEIATLAIDLLLIVASRYLDRNDRQYAMSKFTGIAADACAVLLQTRDQETALQYLEKGRAVILGQAIDDWNDLSFLREEHMELATNLKALRDVVNISSSRLSAEPDRFLAAQQRRAAAKELELCIQSIRELPGQEQFMATQSIEDMQACAADGTVVVVNVTDSRSDAIILSTKAIHTASLPDEFGPEARKWISKEWHGPRSQRGLRNKEYMAFLNWLWGYVKFILYVVGHADDSLAIDCLPRIWWVGTGLASSLPFHAAGDHSPGSTENTFSHVTSSYASSIKTLSYSRSRCSVNIGSDWKTMIATMPVTPGLKADRARLPGVVTEKRNVTDILQHHSTIEDVEQPSTKGVIRHLEDCNIAHFACHGRTNLLDPLSSGLILQRTDDNGSAVQDLLTVHGLSEINLQNARLAYLSACSTAENKAARLADEAIHVVSGFQVAGFPHVIGCLWPSVDQVCTEVARSFYASLVAQGSLCLDSKAIAVALHRSVLEARAKDWKRPLNWAQFVHYGA
ncbi:MAG: hypothetical protein GOMPHAMPRED_005962 [Gomphillus americanus]|uniref:CHAT domain-containing protein n=1 Tax=Gomphillus americanus TaxID=1940652 RepID=A0A8H3ISF4_9LECA|nr:MAG: hypothetical protein GOMPHAMPRED_005962 [Gomphillus americanus]